MSTKKVISDEYIKQRYGSAADYFATKTSYVSAAELFPKLGYGECYRDNDAEVQVNFIILF